MEMSSIETEIGEEKLLTYLRDPSICPFCRSAYISQQEHYDPVKMGDYCIHNVWCEDCDRDWDEIFFLGAIIEQGKIQVPRNTMAKALAACKAVVEVSSTAKWEFSDILEAIQMCREVINGTAEIDRNPEDSSGNEAEHP